jgi:hypothetical protein
MMLVIIQSLYISLILFLLNSNMVIYSSVRNVMLPSYHVCEIYFSPVTRIRSMDEQ